MNFSRVVVFIISFKMVPFEVVLILSAIKFLLFFYFIWKNRHLYLLSYRLPGPFAVPFIGNLHLLLSFRKNVFEKVNEIISKNKETFRFWFGPKLLYITKNPDHVRQILHCPVFQSSEADSILQSCRSNSKETDRRWRIHKKLIKPFLNVKFVIDNIATFQDHMKICLSKLKNQVDVNGGSFVDIQENIELCFVDIFGEIILGKRIESQKGKNRSFITSITTLKNLTNHWMLYSWLNLNFLYKHTKIYQQVLDAKETQRYFIENIIRKSWERRKMDVFGENKTSNGFRSSPLVDRIADFIENNPKVIQNEEFRDYLLKIFLSAEHSLSTVAGFACLCFGMYPDYQKKAVDEIEMIIGDTSGAVLKFEDLYQLKYLEMCILEVLRLVPLNPFTLRSFEESIEIDGLKIPPTCTILLPNQLMNRSETFKHPNQFYPEHFNPKNIKSKDFYKLDSYGVGSRECMGRVLSIVGLKIFLINILQMFSIEAEGNIEDIRFVASNYANSSNGFKVHLKYKK